MTVSHADRLARFVNEATAMVIFTGAGLSTESGIPDFRSPGGIWANNRPIEFGEFVASEASRVEAWRRRFATSSVLEEARPNRGHLAIAELVRRGTVSAVITQNVDGLHQASGVPDSHVVELHGNTTYAKCLDCDRRRELRDVRASFERTGETATISFGQPMPLEPMRRAEACTLACDLFIAIGSSLVVYPAAGFPALAKRRGARLVILNRDPTDQDDSADLVLHAEIGPTLEALIQVRPTQ
jgi:NAD-dependent deacetylase